MSKRHVKKGDEVVVIAGKWKGEKGKVLSVLATDRVVLELVGLSPEKRRQIGRRSLRRRQDRPHGGLVERAVSVHISNVGKKREEAPAGAVPAAAPATASAAATPAAEKEAPAPRKRKAKPAAKAPKAAKTAKG
jgi:large subunit ribosomal protein L24